MPPPPQTPESTDAQRLLETLTDNSFPAWYRKRVSRANIESGHAAYNTPNSEKPPTRYSPSQLLGCHRKHYYQYHNAPEERADPHGIYWSGTRFEEDLALPYLRDMAAEHTAYIQNSIWVDYDVETDTGPLTIRGLTDPVIVDDQGVPILPTEIKTKSKLQHQDAPDATHRAQLHAYLRGLSETYGTEVTQGAILYLSRTTLDARLFEITFDTGFWTETVLEWTETQTEYRLNGSLPPAEPRTEWECQYCPFRQRCGEGQRPVSDCGAIGFLPRFSKYPRAKILAYLAVDATRQLTPTLATHHPDLARQYPTGDWHCPRCAATYVWDGVEWDGDVTQPPRCPECSEEDSSVILSGPAPRTAAQPVEGQ